MDTAQNKLDDWRLALLEGRCEGVRVLERACDESGRWLCCTLENGGLHLVARGDIGDRLPQVRGGLARAAAAHVELCLHERLGE